MRATVNAIRLVATGGWVTWPDGSSRIEELSEP